MICDQVHEPYLSNAYKQQITDNDIESSWSDSNEKLAFYMANKVKYRMKQHFQLYQRNDLIHKCLMYPVIALSTIVGTVNYNADQSYMKYVISSINIANALLLSYIKFTNLGQLSESHNQSYIHYDLLYRKIVRELVHEPRERTHARDFMNGVSERYDDLLKLCPTISENGSNTNTPTIFERNMSSKSRSEKPSRKNHKTFDPKMATTEVLFSKSPRWAEWQSDISPFDKIDKNAMKALSSMQHSMYPLSRAQQSWKNLTLKMIRLHQIPTTNNTSSHPPHHDEMIIEENPLFASSLPLPRTVDHVV